MRFAASENAEEQQAVNKLRKSCGYSAELHATIPTDRANYIEMHERRLEALRRVGIVERTADGVFLIPENYEERVRQHEARGVRQSARVTVIDRKSVCPSLKRWPIDANRGLLRL